MLMKFKHCIQVEILTSVLKIFLKFLLVELTNKGMNLVDGSRV